MLFTHCSFYHFPFDLVIARQQSYELKVTIDRKLFIRNKAICNLFANYLPILEDAILKQLCS